MMKHLLLSYIITLSLSCFSQIHFSVEDSNDKLITALTVKENILIYAYGVFDGINHYSIIKKSVGDVITTLSLQNSSVYYTTVDKIFTTDFNIYLVGLKKNSFADSSRFYILKCDLNLNPLDTIFIKPYKAITQFFKITNQFPEIQVIYVGETGLTPYQKQIFTTSFTVDGQILYHRETPIISNSTIYFSGVSTTPSGNIALNGFYSAANSCSFLFSDSLTFIYEWRYPGINVFGQFYNGIDTYSQTTFINDTTAYITGRAFYNDSLYTQTESYIQTMLADTLGRVYKYNLKGSPDTTEYPSFLQEHVRINNRIYLVWNKNINASCMPHCEENSWIIITCMDDSLNILWERSIGGDNFYFASIVESKNDNEVVIAGSVYKWNEIGKPLEILIYTVSEDGIVTSSSETILQNEEIFFYPNPGYDYFYIQPLDNQVKHYNFNLYDLNGRKRLTYNYFGGIHKIDTSQLSNGIYIYTIRTNDSIISGKWIKMEP